MSSDEIRILGIKAFGYHGVFSDEREQGQEFICDLTLYRSLAEAGKSDALEDTVDYSQVAAEVKEIIEGRPFNLIERVATEIAERIKSNFKLEKIEVVIHKPRAPMSIEFTDVLVKIIR
jgi:dihydroneopterin aldolase